MSVRQRDYIQLLKIRVTTDMATRRLRPSTAIMFFVPGESRQTLRRHRSAEYFHREKRPNSESP